MKSSPIVILTALDLEYDAVRSMLTAPQLHRHHAGTRFEVGVLEGVGCRVAIGIVGKGNHPAAVLAERAIAEFDPAALLFVGVAGALRPKIELGDVVVATHVYAYHGATSEDDGAKARPRSWEMAHECDQIARHVQRSGEWVRRLPAGTTRPKVRFGPIAAGEVVQDSAISANAQWIRQTYNDALAIEMEGAGIAQAAHLNRSRPVMVIRGISDRADGTKSATDGQNWQPRAAAHAAAFAAALVSELIQLPPGSATVAPTGRAPSMTEIRNVAKGNATVGFQAGHIYGTVFTGMTTGRQPELLSEIADLRERLRHARATGELDGPTCDAAEQELAVVTESLGQNDPERTSRVLVALKKLRGLISDIADLGIKVTALITAVRTLP